MLKLVFKVCYIPVLNVKDSNLVLLLTNVLWAPQPSTLIERPADSVGSDLSSIIIPLSAKVNENFEDPLNRLTEIFKNSKTYSGW